MGHYLVTGGAGFIGSALVRALLSAGHSVRVLDNLSTGKRENLAGLAGSLDIREHDLLDLAAVRAACVDVEYVLHQAALASVFRSVEDPVTSHRQNVDGTLNLLLAARDAGVRRIVYAGSSSAYGETPTLPKREEMAPKPISPYAVQKLSGEHYMAAFYHSYGLETVSLRYFNVFGPRQDPNSMYSGVLARFCTALLAGEQPVIYGDGEQSRDFTYVDNVVSANLLALSAPAEQVCGRAFNTATGKRYTLNETFAILKRITGYQGEPRYAESRKADIQHSLADNSAAAEAFGYRPLVDFETGLERTLNWYSERQERDRAPARNP